MRVGRVFAAQGDPVVPYLIRLMTLPFAIVTDWFVAPVLRVVDRGPRSWWVVEVRFDGWDAEFVRIAEESTKAGAKDRLAVINGTEHSAC